MQNPKNPSKSVKHEAFLINSYLQVGFIKEPLVRKYEAKGQNKDDAAHTTRRVEVIYRITSISSIQL